MEQFFKLETEAFAGPLEALLNMIEDRKMSISDISLSDVTDAYLAYVEKLPKMPLAETAQFILIASTLLLIKSRTLLPSLELSVEECESVHELEWRLTQYAIIRNAAKILRGSCGVAPIALALRTPARPTIFSPAEASTSLIYDAAIRLLASIPKPTTMAQAAIAPVLALEDVIRDLNKRLSSAIRTRFSELTRNAADRHEVVVYFLAVLELVRSGSASVTQDKLFSDITIEIEGVTGTPRYGL
jgi:segregation and condensation protein A